MSLDESKDSSKKKIFDDQLKKLKEKFVTYLENYQTHPIYIALLNNPHLNVNKEERKKLLNLSYFDEYITSDEENNFEAKELVEEGEIIDPMMIQQFEESEEEGEDKSEEKQIEVRDEALEFYETMNFEARNLLTCDELFALYLRHTC